MTNSAFGKQIQNRNFLSGVAFKFNLAKFPKVDFFSNSARIPEIVLGTAIQASYLKDLDIPGEKLTYGDLTIRFLVDENMQNYMAMHNWLKGIGFPETPQQFADQTTDRDGLNDPLEVFSDGSLHILNSNFQDVAIVKFSDKKGEFELFLFAEILVKNRDKLRESESFVITLQKDKILGETTKKRINVRKIMSLEEVINKPYSKVTIELKENFNINEIKDILSKNGETKVQLIIKNKNKMVKSRE